MPVIKPAAPVTWGGKAKVAGKSAPRGGLAFTGSARIGPA